jgi:hypothetical protein
MATGEYIERNTHANSRQVDRIARIEAVLTQEAKATML